MEPQNHRKAKMYVFETTTKTKKHRKGTNKTQNGIKQYRHHRQGRIQKKRPAKKTRKNSKKVLKSRRTAAKSAKPRKIAPENEKRPKAAKLQKSGSKPPQNHQTAKMAPWKVPKKAQNCNNKKRFETTARSTKPQKKQPRGKITKQRKFRLLFVRLLFDPH